jgi:SAM-dependent methyltransferase
MPVEAASELGETFDQIVCTGVLHHLADPNRGVRALREVLAPKGAMQLMVYAPYGRAGIYLMQQYCRNLGISSSTKDIAALDKALKKLSSDHPLQTVLQNAPDFRNSGAMADALLNPRDRSFSVPEVFDFPKTGLKPPTSVGK